MSEAFGRLIISLESEMDRDARRKVLQRLGCPPGQIDDNIGWLHFWGYLQSQCHFSEDNVDSRIFKAVGLVRVGQMIDSFKSSSSSAVQKRTIQTPVMSLEDIAAQECIWSSVGSRLPEIQLQLDYYLRSSGMPESLGWWHLITYASGPKIKTYTLFIQCQQQRCLPQLYKAISAVLPLTGSRLGPILDVAQRPYQETESVEPSSSLASIAESRKKYDKLSASNLLKETDDADLEDLVMVLMVELNKNEAWFKFAQKKGVTTNPKGAEIIRQARLEKRPAQRVVRDLANVEGYLAMTFLEELKSLEIPDVTISVNKIKEHIAKQLHEASVKDEEEATVHGEVYDWLVGNKLVSPERAQQCLRLFLDKGVTELDDIKYLEASNFEACGLDMAKAQKAAFLATKMRTH